ncbi:MAG: hypothetical protein ACOC93_00810 [Planctomycetota bacterium]
MLDATHPIRQDEEKTFCRRNEQASLAVINRLRQLRLGSPLAKQADAHERQERPE